MQMTPTAAKEVLLEPSALHVMMAVEAQEGIYRLMCNQQWRPKSINFGHAKKSWDMEHDTKICIPQAIYSQVHKRENGRTSSTQTTRAAWSGIQTSPQLIQALVPVCIHKALEATLSSTPQYMTIRL
jgi:hypothetical protein